MPNMGHVFHSLAQGLTELERWELVASLVPAGSFGLSLSVFTRSTLTTTPTTGSTKAVWIHRLCQRQ